MTVARTTVVRDRYGLHPRAAMRNSQAAARFRAPVTLEDLTAGGDPADAQSLLALVGAAIRFGDWVRAVADGDDVEAAVEAIAAPRAPSGRRVRRAE